MPDTLCYKIISMVYVDLQLAYEKLDTLEVFNYKHKMIVKFNYVLQIVVPFSLFYILRDT